MEDYAMSQILLVMWIPYAEFLPYIQKIGRENRVDTKNIIILKARGSMTHKSEAMLLKQLLAEKEHGVVIINPEMNPEDIERKLIGSRKSIEKHIADIKNPITMIESMPNPMRDIELLTVKKENHLFISKDSGGHIAKPGTKEGRKFINSYQKNSYRKKRKGR